jgi:hypothetical protein
LTEKTSDTLILTESIVGKNDDLFVKRPVQETVVTREVERSHGTGKTACSHLLAGCPEGEGTALGEKPPEGQIPSLIFPPLIFKMIILS